MNPSSSCQTSPEQVEQWILNSNHPTDHNGRRLSVQALQQWTQSNNTDRLFPILFHLLQHSSHIPVQFHALTVLGSFTTQLVGGIQNRTHLRRFLLQSTPSSSTEPEPSFLRKKKAQILATHMIHDGGTPNWPSVDHDLASLSDPLLFLQTMIAVLDEFQTVSHRYHNNNNANSTTTTTVGTTASVVDTKITTEQTRRFKHILKGYTETCTNGTLLERLFALVVRLLETSCRTEIAETALCAIEAFFRWTDVSFLGVANLRCYDLMLAALVQSPTLAVQVASVKAFQELTLTHADPQSHSAVSTPLDPTLLSKLLQHIHMTQQLPYPAQPGKKSTEAADVDGDTMELIIAMSCVVNNVGLFLLTDTASTSSAVWPQVLDLFFRCFAYDDIDVTTAVLPLAMKIVPLLAAHQKQEIPLLLNTLYEQMEYPADFGYDFNDDDDAEEEAFRLQLGKVYESLVQTCPTTCLQFLGEAVKAQFATSDAASTPTPEIEATLRLVYRYCGGVRPGVKALLRDDCFRSLLRTIHASSITKHPHGHVLCLYYESTVRYADFFTKDDGLKTSHRGDLLTLLSRPSPFANETGPLACGEFEPVKQDIATTATADAHPLLHNAKILVGAGGLGCEILKDLALSGFVNIDVIDLDAIDVTNLNRQFLFRQKDVGSSKADTAAAFINKRCPWVKVKSHHGMIQDKDPSFYKSLHCIISGLDNIEAHRWLNSTVVGLVEFDDDGDMDPSTIIPIIDGGTEAFSGQARFILPRITSCFECTIDAFPPQTSFPLCTIAETPRRPEHCVAYAFILQWPKEFPDTKLDKDSPEHMKWVYEKALERSKKYNISGVTYMLTMGVVKNIIPAVASTNAIISAACVNEAVKFVTFGSQNVNSYMMYMGSSGVHSHTFAYEQKPDCIVCTSTVRKVDVSKSVTLNEFIQSELVEGVLRLKSPSLVSGSGTTLYMQKPPALEKSTRPNLDKALSALIQNGEEITVTDPLLERTAATLAISFV